jgi:nitrite reductase/ring-hydroxylating ferredoxin subunit
MAEASHDKPDLTNGVPENDLDDGAMLVGQVGEEAVLLARRGREVFAIGATCTHYGGPLDERSRGAARATASGRISPFRGEGGKVRSRRSAADG